MISTEYKYATGASAGIGAAIIVKWADSGVHVVAMRENVLEVNAITHYIRYILL